MPDLSTENEVLETTPSGPGNNILRFPNDSCPLDLEAEFVGNLIYAWSSVNKSPQLSILVDCGTGESVIDPRAAVEIRGTRSEDKTGTSFGGFVEGAALELACTPRHLELKSQASALLSMESVNVQTGRKTDGAFGSNWFTRFFITMDYEKQKVQLQPFAVPLETSGEAVQLELEGGIPFVRATLEAKDGSRISTRFMIRSGIADAIILNEGFLKSHRQLVEEYGPFPYGTGDRRSVQRGQTRLAGIEIGSFRMAEPLAAVRDQKYWRYHNVAGFIGAGILSRFKVIWDYSTPCVRLTANSNFSAPFPADASGLHLLARPLNLETISVAAVRRNSPADLVSLKTGDVIAAIDGRKKLPLWEVREHLQKSGVTVELSVLRGNQEFTVALPLVPWI